ncbi:phosphoesterase PA-phosphatase-like protein [Salinarchaeum sp. Harcht-Bsk1]|uniref:phosphatase PAP2 family protein n=1 Tax=Salinarchaeum sp. Harcht-Bsk1 TaxID=1333523 RepID=UPI0003423765|nr:phosphatase PAP2 family protein [Salinarchaeum sp. Harcht-Bsk1]AGN01616.1 phosphoesterase PA-phosphatase-like protein [Salinarchaeum sp. Harcht-Bsk1]
MSRSLGVVELIHSLLPDQSALLLGLLTQLGDVWFLFGATVVTYLFRPRDRERVAVVLGLALSTAALVEALKAVFALPRPTTPLATAELYPAALRGIFEATATGGGHGFPSGHATLSTVVLLGLAGAVRVGDARWRWLLAGGLVALVSLTRVALGVHYLVDVVAGVLIGLTVLAGVAWATEASPLDRPTTAFVIAATVGVAGVLVTAPTLGLDGSARPPHDSVVALGAALGALAGWQGLRLRATGTADPVAPDGDRLDTERWPPLRALLAVGPMLALLALVITGLVVGDEAAATAGLAGIGFGFAVALPVLVPEFDRLVAGYVPQWFRGETA